MLLSLIGRGIARITQSQALFPDRECPSALAINLAFDGTNALEIDLGSFVDERRLSAIKTIYINNADNVLPVTVTQNDTGQSITFAPYTQGYFNILSGQRPHMTFTCAGAVTVPVQLINIEIAPNQWTVLGGTTVSITGTVTTSEIGTDAIDVSGSITTGGTAQQVMTANANRREAWVFNNDIAFTSTSLWINFTGGTAVQNSPSLEIPPGSAWAGQVTDEISIIGPTTGQKYGAGYR